MSSFTDWIRKLGHRLCKTQVPEKFLVPRLSAHLEIADARLFRKLVQKGRLAPFYPGHDEPNTETEVVECPICCTYYKVMNKTKCCGQRICSECIVKIRIGCPFSGSTCPFCKKPGLDVDICEGKTETEKREDLLEEQRFTECRLRQLAEANCGRESVTNEDDGDRNSPEELPEQESDSPPAIPQEPESTQTREHHVPETSLRDTESNHYCPPTPSSVQDEYRQEYEALSSRVMASSNLSHSELQQCEQYLGVNPTDLGLRLEEFNDLLLEQTLMYSMIEMRKAEKRQEEEQHQQLNRAEETTTTTHDPGASSSAVVNEAETSPPSLRSHSLPLAHPISHDEEDNSPDAESSMGTLWTLDNVLRQVSSSAPFSFLTSLRNSGESSNGSPEETLPTPFSVDPVPEVTRDVPVAQREGPSAVESSSSSESSTALVSGWNNLLNSLAGFSDVHTQFRMMTVRFDDPQIDAAFNGHPRPTDTPDAIEMMPQETKVEEDIQHVTEETQVAGNKTTKTVAVENPDGSFALISVPCEETNTDAETQGTRQTESSVDVNPQDTAVVTATQNADRSQLDAIEAADVRLRQLYSRPS